MARAGAINKKKGQPINNLRENLLAVLCATTFTSTACADVRFDTAGVVHAGAVKKFDGLRQRGFLLSYRVDSESDRIWTPSSLEVSAGWLERGDHASAYMSFGPSYRMYFTHKSYGRWFTDFGSIPTYISKSDFGGKPLGGKFFFASYLGIGAYLDRHRKSTFLLRYQHMSNAGIDGDNPGVDMLGVTFNYHFGRDERVFAAEIQ